MLRRALASTIAKVAAKISQPATYDDFHAALKAR